MPRAWRPMLRAMLLLLALCLVCQGLAVSARRALGPGHFHLRTPAAISALQAEAAAHHHEGVGRSDAGLPFGGRLRSHAALHSETEHHSHLAATAGVVTVGEGDTTSPLQAWAVVVRSALDLPVLLTPAALLPVLAARSAWVVEGTAAFDSRHTASLLQPPKR